MPADTKIKIWLKAMRLRTLPLALSSIAMGSFLAASESKFNLLIFTLCITTTVFLQILSNLANDFGDSIHGADSTERLGPPRTVQTGQISKKGMRTAILITTLMAFLSGLLLLIYSFERISQGFYIFLGLGLASILAALGYTLGKKPYGYAGFGDLFVMVFFGLVGVFGTYFLFTGMFNPSILFPALCSGFMATAVLNINNIRDINSDIKAGKKSIPVRLGRKKAVYYHWFLLTATFLSAGMYVSIEFNSYYQLAFLLTSPLFIANGLAVSQKIDPVELDPNLKKMALISLLFTLVFGISLLI